MRSVSQFFHLSSAFILILAFRVAHIGASTCAYVCFCLEERDSKSECIFTAQGRCFCGGLFRVHGYKWMGTFHPQLLCARENFDIHVLWALFTFPWQISLSLYIPHKSLSTSFQNHTHTLRLRS